MAAVRTTHPDPGKSTTRQLMDHIELQPTASILDFKQWEENQGSDLLDAVTKITAELKPNSFQKKFLDDVFDKLPDCKNISTENKKALLFLLFCDRIHQETSLHGVFNIVLTAFHPKYKEFRLPSTWWGNLRASGIKDDKGNIYKVGGRFNLVMKAAKNKMDQLKTSPEEILACGEYRAFFETHLNGYLIGDTQSVFNYFFETSAFKKLKREQFEATPAGKMNAAIKQIMVDIIQERASELRQTVFDVTSAVAGTVSETAATVRDSLYEAGAVVSEQFNVENVKLHLSTWFANIVSRVAETPVDEVKQNRRRVLGAPGAIDS
jgi:hypothetical protein